MENFKDFYFVLLWWMEWKNDKEEETRNKLANKKHSSANRKKRDRNDGFLKGVRRLFLITFFA